MNPLNLVMLAFLLILYPGQGALQAQNLSRTLTADLLIVGGTESGCAAAVQAARMGVKSIVLVNDIDWLGGQFSAESLVAIDENRGPEGYGHGVPFPRSGMFREVIDRIEEINLEKYGVARPGNTRVITTCRPADAEQAFRELVTPAVESGALKIESFYEPVEVMLDSTRGRVTGVRFQSLKGGQGELTVQAKLTIDASDWGDVIRLSGAEYEFGPDLKSKYGEPLAPESREDYPLTDMNPITYCMVVVESKTAEPIPVPLNYDRRNYDGLPYPSDPFWIYESRRVVDRYGFQQISHPDVVLLCFPAFDYPLDVLPQRVVDALENSERGASHKNIVEMTRKQRQIVFDDAKQRSLGFLYYLQTVGAERKADRSDCFARMKLSDEFGTDDHLPMKPYIRESLRMNAMYMLRQQDTAGVGDIATNYATAMPHDVIACWQFEYDFHPTMRKFLTEDHDGPWHPDFREGRRWGPPYSGKAQFPLRCAIPEKMNGLLGGQKNLGYSSIVSSAVRLHDESTQIGQGIGAAAAVALRHDLDPREIPWRADLLAEIWLGLLSKSGAGQCLWPFGDLDPEDDAYVAVNQLAARGILPLGPDDVDFGAEDEASDHWRKRVVETSRLKKLIPAEIQEPAGEMTRGEFAIRWWECIEPCPEIPFKILAEDDADGDGISDGDDPVPLLTGRSSWASWRPDPFTDGLPDHNLRTGVATRRINFTGRGGANVEGFENDSGNVFDRERGFGWKRDISASHRRRGRFEEDLRDSFLFTRTHDTWECTLPNGKYQVTVCAGDSGHEQFGQNVTVEGIAVFRSLSTAAGRFREQAVTVTVSDGLLTVEIGLPGSTTNTCLNWVVVMPAE